MDVEEARLAEIGPDWDALFAAGPGVQSSRWWFAATEEAALPSGSRAVVLLCRAAGRPVAMLPLLLGPGRQVRSLTTVYTTLFQPGLAPGLAEADIVEAGTAIGRWCRRWPTLVLDAMDPDWAGSVPFLAGLRASGLFTRRFKHFGNWHTPASGWDAYLAGRPGPLRETIRRRTRACDRDPALRIEVIHGGPALGAGVAAYEEVYRRSWKQPEVAPDFTSALLTRAAAAGALRLGVMWRGTQPLAAQYWMVAGGTATVLKLAHDDTARSLSPGTVLTAHVIKSVLQAGVRELDFGRGDDEYKAGWTGERRQRISYLVGNFWRPAGAMALLRHDAGRALRGSV